MNFLTKLQFNGRLNNNMLFLSPKSIYVNSIVLSRRALPVVQQVRTGLIRPTKPPFASEIGHFHRGVLRKQTTAFGKQHESVIDSSLRTDKKASHSTTVLTSKPYAHKVDPTVSETAVLSQTTLAKGGEGTQYYVWKDFGPKRVNQYQIKNNFTSRRPTTPEEAANFKAGQLLKNEPIYRHNDVTAQARFRTTAELKKPTTLEEQEMKKHKLKPKKEPEKNPKEKETKKTNESELQKSDKND